jgi:hypothetical protein
MLLRLAFKMNESFPSFIDSIPQLIKIFLVILCSCNYELPQFVVICIQRLQFAVLGQQFLCLGCNAGASKQ